MGITCRLLDGVMLGVGVVDIEIESKCNRMQLREFAEFVGGSNRN